MAVTLTVGKNNFYRFVPVPVRVKEGHIGSVRTMTQVAGASVFKFCGRTEVLQSVTEEPLQSLNDPGSDSPGHRGTGLRRRGGRCHAVTVPRCRRRR